MSIGATLSNALSGLRVNARSAEVLSSNVANATTEGYGRRELLQGTRPLGGVTAQGVLRHGDPILLGDRRASDAGLGAADVKAGFYSRLEGIIGTPDEASSLSGRIANLEAALTEAASRPDSQPRLSAAADAAVGLANHLNDVSDGIQGMRLSADGDIARAVDDLNASIRNIADLNKQIISSKTQGRDISGLLDLRHQEIDKVSRIVPIREVARENGTVSLFTPTGATLLDPQPATFGFTKVNTVTAEMTIESGALSGLTLNGRAIRTEGEGSPIAGGALAAHFELRDRLAPAAQANADAVARDLIERFADPSVDPTLAPGDAGLLTDGGFAFDPLNEPGIAGRIRVNAQVLPEEGGALWRIRDGVMAPAEGDVGNARLLQSLSDALTARRTPASGEFTVARTASGRSADFLSGIGAGRRSAEAQQTFAASRNASFRMQEAANGVDTDAEMQKLLLIEQAYAANARVISAVDEMMQTLLRM